MKLFQHSLFVLLIFLVQRSFSQKHEIGFKIQLDPRTQIDYSKDRMGLFTDLGAVPIGDLSSYWISPAYDYIPQWMYIKKNRHQIDLSVNRFNFNYNYPFHDPFDNNIFEKNQRFRVDEYALRYQFYFSKKQVQPYVFAGAAYQSLAYYYGLYSKLGWPGPIPDLDWSRYIKGHLVQANAGVGVLWNMNPLSFYVQLAMPLKIWGSIQDSGIYKSTNYDLTDPENPIPLTSQTSHFAVTNNPARWNGKINSKNLQFGVQYNLNQKTEWKKPSKENLKQSHLNVHFKLNASNSNYGFASRAIDVNFNNKLQIEFGINQYPRYDEMGMLDYKYYNYSVFSKVFRKKHLQYSGGLGYMRWANYRHMSLLMQAEIEYVFKYDFRLGIKAQKGVDSINNRDFIKHINGVPVCITVKIPIFDTRWIPHIPEAFGLDALKKK